MSSRVVRIGTLAATVLLLAVAVIGLLRGGPAPVDRAYELEQRLRCPVCKSVSIAESGSDTAVAMRQVVTEQIAAGRSDAEIVDYFRARYGDWVLLDPPARGSTARRHAPAHPSPPGASAGPVRVRPGKGERRGRAHPRRGARGRALMAADVLLPAEAAT